ncbi:CUE domain protein [Sporothrix brasiliensis 5110]|uniref:CUE domain protein n=1 Tax=Sporothrix brasiliensis 5110 TaxID=1398154 RepID=A0A0C2ITH3_9PEZI|nr:CUE domain protein [Sporothrix brasiliensis 5110]KIH90105.1 CUE domain protein [Sporothrix brasiliensis 5110]
MDAFVTRQTKRKLGSPSPPPVDPTTPCIGRVDLPETTAFVDEDDESTEVKLAILASLLAGEGGGSGSVDIHQDMLLELLLAHEGSVEAAVDAFHSRPDKWRHKKKLKLDGVVGQQTSLRSFVPQTNTASPEKKAGGGPATTLLSRRGRTLHLYDPVDIEAHTPCTLVHNFLPPDMANDLLREMLAEAKTFGAPYTFKLFDQTVSSPHTSCLYLESAAEAEEARASSGAGTSNEGGYHPTSQNQTGQQLSLDKPNDETFVLATDTHEGYRYNGSRLSDIRTVTPHMARVRPLVEAAVNQAIQRRIATHYPGGRKLRYQNLRPWRPNAAFVNCYNGGQESVGWHSDHLTYLGPRAVIGSMSLGVAREFRVRHIVPRDPSKDPKNTKDAKEDDAAGQISIHLPHNSLLIMHAEMQEEWKHCVTPAPSIDPHPISGIKRINVTYRDYRADFHPNYIPRCKCGIACVLRVVQRKLENHGRYFWMCHAGNIPDREGCTFFLWAEFDDDGVPVWKLKDKEREKAGMGYTD